MLRTYILRVNVREYGFSFNVQVIDSHLSIALFIYMVPVCILNNVQQNVHFMHVSVFFLKLFTIPTLICETLLCVTKDQSNT